MNYCIVGLGRHATRRVIPSILESKSKLIATVSTRNNNIQNVPNFKNLSIAFKKLPKNTIFYLCAPLSVRQKQIINCLKNSYNVISEKPIFIEIKYLNESLTYIKQKRLFLYEHLIYVNSIAYEKFLSLYQSKKNQIHKINLNFLIPSFPKNTFRDQYSLEENIIYDIGCYPISFLGNLKLNLNDYKLSFKRSNSNKKLLIFIFDNEFLKIKIKIGISKIYQNNLEVFYSKNKVLFNYFFYGLSQKKNQKFFFDNKLVKNKSYLDRNSFIFLFNQKASFFKNNKKCLQKNYQSIVFLKKFLKLVNTSN